MGTVHCPVLTNSYITVHNITPKYHCIAEAENKDTVYHIHQHATVLLKKQELFSFKYQINALTICETKSQSLFFDIFWHNHAIIRNYMTSLKSLSIN
jgi:hypothetical protein